MPTDQTSGDTEFWTALGKRLREHRDNAGLSQEQVAEKLDLPRSAVSDMERGTRKVYALELGALAKLYGTTTDTLLDGIGPETESGEPANALLDAATEFRFPLYPEGHEYWDLAEMAVTVEWRGNGRWAVMHRGCAHDADGQREYESIPSDRTDEFKARYRHSRDDAVRIARDIVVPAERARWDARLARKTAGEPR